MRNLIPTSDREWLLATLKRLHQDIRANVVAACERSLIETLSAIAKEEEGDTIYAVDRVSEEVLVDFIEREIASRSPVVLIAEGLPNGKITLPSGTNEASASLRIIVDPIDGTRGLMYQKRSGWILTGVAPNLGPDTSLNHIELAIQTEIPLVKQHLSDSVWVSRGEGVTAERFNRLTQEITEITLRPSQAKTIAHGYAEIARFFPGTRDVLAAIDEEVVFEVLGPVQEGKAHCFEDQYASSGGQLYELMSGHERFIADIRPLMNRILTAKGLPLGICCHPYDVCTELIAREAGVIVTDVLGKPLSDSLSVDPNVAWIGYANIAIQQQIQPALLAALQRRNLISVQ